MSTDGNSIEGMSFTGENSTVPPGFRFHPTDEELVGYYLTKKVACNKIDLDVIREIDLYKLEPWDLQERCKIGSAEQHEWYFFSHKDKKYPTGTRTNRATTAGFWKATGRDKPIFARVKLIGMRKTLVFYKGRAPNGQKSDWIMHEYRLEDDINNTTTNEEGWVVCRVFKKRSIVKKPSSDYDGGCCYDEEPGQAKLSSSTLTSSQYNGGQSSTTSTPNDSSNNNNSTQGLLVKQELENPFYFPFPYDTYSQLPRLESPKRSCENPSTTTSCSMGNLLEEQNSQVLTSRPSSSRGIDYALEELVQMGAKPSFLHQQADHFHAFQDDLPPASWGMDDRLLTELSQDEYPKDTRFPMTGNLMTELPHRSSSSSSSKRGHLLQPQQQEQLLQMAQMPDYSYDVDLWSFSSR